MPSVNILLDALPRRDVRSLVQSLAKEAGVQLRPTRYVAPFDGVAGGSSAVVRMEETDGPFIACALYTTAPLTTLAQVLVNGQQLHATRSELLGLFEAPNVDGVGLVTPIALDAAQYLQVDTQVTLAGPANRIIVDGFHVGSGAGNAAAFVAAVRQLGQPWVMRLAILGSTPTAESTREAPDLCEVRRLIVVAGGAVTSTRLQLGRYIYAPRALFNTLDLGGDTGASQASQTQAWLRRADKAQLLQEEPTGVLQTTVLLVARRLPNYANGQLPEWV